MPAKIQRPLKGKIRCKHTVFNHEIQLKILVNTSKMFFINYSFMGIISGFIIEFTKSQKEDIPLSLILSRKLFIRSSLSGGGSEGWRARIMTDWWVMDGCHSNEHQEVLEGIVCVNHDPNGLNVLPK